jgi:hypothetical protein
MTTILALALAAFGVYSPGQAAPAPAPGQTPPPAPPQASTAAANRDDLKDLEAMTFDCPRAGLNAAAREAAKEPSQGTYQFSFFRIASESHHAAYEVHFKSNYTGEPDLKYCVVVYCQQGWDPKTAKMTITKMAGDARPKKTAAHESMCGAVAPPPRKTPR